ncbi:hypothetical protein QS257_11895 [Terrilactibacillus sp. S3-3]|nr:hypothetical protein QS257_11895 [Terrilactibacillus sp. S3-3]
MIFDPFYDLHLLNAVKQLNIGGRYITCGYKNQHKQFIEDTDDINTKKIDRVMLTVMINNLSIMGNCIGTSKDLRDEVATYNSEKKLVPIDSIFSSLEGSQFLDRTYNSSSYRFGKVVLSYV